MNIQTCQAVNLAELMIKVKDQYGPDAVLLAVRRVESAGGERSVPFFIEGTVGFEAKPPSMDSIKSMLARTVLRTVGPRSGSFVGGGIKAASKASPDSYIEHDFGNGNNALTRRERPNADHKKPVRSGIKEVDGAIGPRPEANQKSVALVGPVGSGKTTTAAKIAGQLSLKMKKPVGMISTDTHRPGGASLLMAYAGELGLLATSAASASDLQDRILRWNCRGPVVVDTRGFGPRDSLGIEKLGHCLDSVRGLEERYLVLSATEHPAIARECLDAYAAVGVTGVVLTRIDQAAGIGHCLEQVKRSNMKVVFCGTGERVPEDLMVPSEHSLLALENSRPLLS